MSSGDDLAVEVDERMALLFLADMPFYLHEGEKKDSVAGNASSDTYKLRSSLKVISFTCEESVNCCYRLEVIASLDSKYANLADQFLMQAFSLRVEWRESDGQNSKDKFHLSSGNDSFSNGRSRNFTGRVAECEYIGDSFVNQGDRPECSFYRFVVRPTFWFMSKASRIRTFLKKDVKTILTEVLDTYGKKSASSDIYDDSSGSGGDSQENANSKEFTVAYSMDNVETKDSVVNAAMASLFEPRTFVMQYEESDFDFFVRWLERQGWYFYFEFADTQPDADGLLSNYQDEKVVVASRNVLRKIGGGGDDFLRRSFLADSQIGLNSFTSKSQGIVSKVMVRDFNPSDPSKKLVGSYTSTAKNAVLPGIVLEDEFFASVSEGNALARCRMEGYECRSAYYEGGSNLPAMTPGYSYFPYAATASADNWAHDAHLLTAVRHRGQLARAETVSAINAYGVDLPAIGYENTFESVKFSLPYRPAITRRVPRIPAPTRAWVLPIDDQGCTATSEGYYYVRILGVEPIDAKAMESGSAGPMPGLIPSAGLNAAQYTTIFFIAYLPPIERERRRHWRCVVTLLQAHELAL